MMAKSLAEAAELTTVTTYGRGAGSARVRVFGWTDRLGLRTTSASYLGGRSNAPADLLRHPVKVLSAEVGLRRLTREDSSLPVLISRQASPFSNGSIESRLLRSRTHGVYDFDDALPHTPPAGLRRPWSKRRVWQESVRAADLVIAGNAYLAELASAETDRVVVIPSCVEPGEYVAKADYGIGERPPVAVWLGSPSTEAHLLSIAGPLLQANQETGLRVKLISAGNSDLGALAPIVDRAEWDPSTVAQELASADVGIMPLPDTPWNRGKCGYKLLQYGASALPLVGSPVGVNRDILSAADGLAPGSESEWADALIEIAREPETARRGRGRAARETVSRGYSYDVWERAWRDAVGV